MRDLAPFSPGSLPADLPLAEAAPRAAWSTVRLTTKVCASLVVLTVLTSRLALPLGAKQVPITLLVAIVHLVMIALLNRGAVSLPRLLATGAVLAIVTFETALVHRHTSMLSLLYLFAIYVPLVVTTTIGAGSLPRIWRAYIGVGVVAAVLGVLQIMVQAVGGGYYLDPVQQLPEALQLRGFSITYPIMRGVIPTLKANGMLFVEPAALSQFLAVAFVGEVYFFRRWLIMALLGAGLLVSFSGTGFLILAGGLALGINARAIIGAVVAGALVTGLLFATGFGEAFTSRIDEVRRPGTSGYERFVAPYVAMALPWEDSVNAVLWGYGAGRVEDLDTEYAANYSPVPKVFLEYGIVGLAAFTALWVAMFRRLAVGRPVTGAILVLYFLVSGTLLQPFSVFAQWALTAGFMKRAASDEESETRLTAAGCDETSEADA